MGIGTTNLAATPCCGLIIRTWECYPDKTSETGWRHTNCQGLENDIYAPQFPEETRRLKWGNCPDCGRFIGWLYNERAEGHATMTKQRGWRWNYSRALAEFQRR